MTINELEELNEKFQKSAVQLSELMPSSGLANATSLIIRSAQIINKEMRRLVHVASEISFNRIMDKMEEEVDEVLFVLDQLGNANKKQQISLINDFLKEGYELLSVYSRVFDSIIEQRIEKEED